jgi:hypothetical protein
MDAVSATIFDGGRAIGERLVENKMSYRIKLISLLFYRFIKKNSITALGQPLQMAAHASDWGNSLNQCRRGGKRVTMVMMFVGGVVLMFGGFLVLFLLYNIYGARVFRSRPNPYSC